MFSTRDFSATLLQTRGDVPVPRYLHSAVLANTTLLICGGTTNLNDQNVLNHDSLYLLNIVSREWTRVVVNGLGPRDRYLPSMTLVGSKLLVFGGLRFGEKAFNDMWTVDLKSLNSQPLWESYEPTTEIRKPLPRFGHVSVATEDRIIIFGGQGDNHYLNDTWSFDISTRKWTELQCTGLIPSPRYGHAAVLIDDVMYVYGGTMCDMFFDDLTVLQLSTQRWFKFHNEGMSPARRSFHTMASDGTRVFVLGGCLPNTRRADDIHVFDTKDFKYPEPEPRRVSVATQTERDQRIARLTDELARKSNLLEQAEAKAVEATRRPRPEDRQLIRTLLVKQIQKDAELVDMQARLGNVQAKLDELLLSHDQQIGQYENELTNVRAKLEAKESELEAVRLRPTDAEKGTDEDEDQVTRGLLERVRAIEAEIMSKRRPGNEKS